MGLGSLMQKSLAPACLSRPRVGIEMLHRVGSQLSVSRHAHSQATRSSQSQTPKSPKSGRYVQEHDYTIKPDTYSYLAEDNLEQFERFPLLSARQLAQRQTRPRRVRMLSRDFIDNSLYNPTYGYFARTARIASPAPFAFDKIKNLDAFIDEWTREHNKATEAAEATPNTKGPTQHVWHTPSELFHPYYGRALARYIVANHSSDKLVIYETGAGNGTLMADILGYIKEHHPDIYAHTEYNVIEISASLALKQRAHAEGHQDVVKINNVSVFEWRKRDDRPCFFVAVEVWDNLAHDIVRYDNITGTPYQGYTVVDSAGEFTQVYYSKLDYWAKRFLELRGSLDYRPNPQLGYHPLRQPLFWRTLKNKLIPFHGNLSPPEYLPTRYLQFLQSLKDYFPEHRLLASDFTHFSGRIPGYGSPVVQTVIDGVPVTVSTFMVLQGFFDIMFPTDFRLAGQLYEAVCGRPAHTASHYDFLAQWSQGDAATRTGENPMLSLYRNAAFLCS